MFKVSNLFQMLFAAAMPMYAFDPKDPADIAIVQGMIDEAVGPLVTKNKELLAEVKKAKKGAEVDPAAHEALETENAALKDQLTAANKATKTATTAAETAEKALKTEQGFTSKLLVSDGLNAALLANGVTNPVHLKAAAAMIREAGGIEVKAEGDARAATIGGKTLAEFVKGWSLSDDGKAFVTAPSNGGGGGAGSGGSGTVVNPWAAATFNLTEQGKILTANPTQAAALQAAAGSAPT